MEKKKTAIARVEEINNELTETLKRAKSENRDFTKEENARIEELRREKNWLSLEMEASRLQRSAADTGLGKYDDMVEFIRNSARDNVNAKTILRADASETSHLTSDLSALQPTTVGDIVEKVEEKLIWHLLGIKMPTGLAGQYEWPIVGDLEAEFAGEGASTTDKKIDISKVAAVQQRAVVKASLTKMSIFNSRGQLLNILTAKMPGAIARKINDVVCNPTKPSTSNTGVQGPFVTATKETIAFTFKGFNEGKAKLLAKGYDEESLVWVMDAATKATLEATPKDTGSGIMTVENNMLCGRPIFVSSKLNGKVGLGDFRYQVVGQFGNADFISDPYSKAGEGKVVLTLNSYFGTATLDQEAFMLFTAATA